MNICDEFNSECLVKSCCSKMCDKVGELVDSYLNHNMDKSWMFHELITNEKCPVCGKEMFWYGKYYRFNSHGHKGIKLECNFCLSTYRLSINRDLNDMLIPEKILEAYQGTIRGNVAKLLTIKKIKELLNAEENKYGV